MKLTSEDGLKVLSDSGQLFVELFRHGTLSVEVYKPVKQDDQTPHERDEVYVIIAGHGTFISGGETCSFKPGDFLFVAARVEHRFENFSDDFSTWVIFYGPPGGEAENL